MDFYDFCNNATDKLYEQEMNRQKTLITKTELLFKWVTLIITILNITIPLIVKETTIDVKNIIFVILYILLMAIFIAIIILIILINFPVKYKRNLSGADWIEYVKNHTDKIKCENDLMYYVIVSKENVVKSLIKNNNRGFKCMLAAHILLSVCIVLMAVFYANIIWGI